MDGRARVDPPARSPIVLPEEGADAVFGAPLDHVVVAVYPSLIPRSGKSGLECAQVWFDLLVILRASGIVIDCHIDWAPGGPACCGVQADSFWCMAGSRDGSTKPISGVSLAELVDGCRGQVLRGKVLCLGCGDRFAQHPVGSGAPLGNVADSTEMPGVFDRLRGRDSG